MKLKNIYTLFFLMVLLVVFQSRSGGPAAIGGLKVTGAPGSVGDQGTCANSGCHIGGGFDAALSIELLSGTDMSPVEEYEPGSKYICRITISTNAGIPEGYGFQAVALDAAENDVSLWSNDQPGTQIVEVGDNNYFEHDNPSPFGNWVIVWDAPAAGAGDVTFYSAGLVINGNGSTNGDETVTNTLTVSEKIESSIAQVERDFAAMTIAPNPIHDQTKLIVTSQVNGDYRLRISDIAGKECFSEMLNLQVGLNEENINLDDLQSGLYFLQLVGEKHIATKQLIKL